MFKNLKYKKASSIIEYMVVVLFILAALFVFQYYISRGLAGRWKAVGDTFGGGRQYDPKAYNQGGTLECFYYGNENSGNWIASQCYEDCLRGKNPGCTISRSGGFGNPGDMGCCRGQCSEFINAYKDCRNTNFLI